MRVLHVVDKLPDARVEKSILTDLKAGHDVSIASSGSIIPLFKELENLKTWSFINTTKHQFGFSIKEVTSQLKDIVNQFDPDLIHANDIYNGYFSSGLERPLVYDDHEFWSKEIKYDRPAGSRFALSWWRRRIGLIIRRKLIPNWEKETLSISTVLCPNPLIAEHHKKFSRDAFVVPNYPSIKEVSEVPQKDSDLASNIVGYIGYDLTIQTGTYRNPENFVDLMKSIGVKLIVIGDKKLPSNEYIDSVGFISHLEIYKYLRKAKWGVLAWKLHPFHPYCNPNKIYLYAHAGLITILPSDINTQGLKYFKTFDDLSEIPKLITQGYSVSPKEIMDHARKELVWEVSEGKINQANKIAIENFKN